MLKQEYVEKTEAFVTHIIHVATSVNWPRRFYDKDRRRVWQCTSLLDAVNNYEYGISPTIWHEVFGFETDPTDRLASNTALLAALAHRLRDARLENDEVATHAACGLILRWGGVSKRGRTGHTNEDRLAEIGRRAGGVLHYLNTVDVALAQNTDDFGAAFRAAPGRLYCNAGFTKIYSLMRDDFVIYDSRVAAALGLLVTDYCQAKNYSTVPDELKFIRMPAGSTQNAEGKWILNQERNPSVHNLRFPPRPNEADGDALHFRSNVRANWLLSSAVEAEQMAAWSVFAFSHRISVLRALEAALFMVGYDLKPAA